VREERRQVVRRAHDEPAQLRRDLDHDSGVEAVHARVRDREALYILPLLPSVPDALRETEPNVEEVRGYRHEPVEVRQFLLELGGRGLDRRRWLHEPALELRVVLLRKVGEEVLERSGSPREVTPGVVEAREELDHVRRG
jgi:hypothetical protein